MDRNAASGTTRGGSDDPLDYPANKVIGAVDPAVLGALVPDLIAAGFAPVGILGGEAGLRRLAGTAGGDGFVGALRRLVMDSGGDLGYVRRAEEELRGGHVLVDVGVEGDDEKERAREVLVRHGGHDVAFFHPWAIEPLG